MTSLRFHIRFPENKIKEPIIYQIGHEFKVVTNVRRADVRETTGWMDLELTGETEEIERAIDGIRTPDDRPAIPRLRFITSHPWDLGDRLIAAMAESPSVCEHLHLPAQSGDDQALRRMGRQYTAAAYMASWPPMQKPTTPTRSPTVASSSSNRSTAPFRIFSAS